MNPQKPVPIERRLKSRNTQGEPTMFEQRLKFERRLKFFKFGLYGTLNEPEKDL